MTSCAPGLDPKLDPRPDPPPRSLRVAFNGIIGTDRSRFANVLWVRSGGASQVTVGDLQSYASYAYNAYKNDFLPSMHTSVVLEGCEVNWYVSGQQLKAFHTENSPGAQTSPILPANVAICISWKVAEAYKGGHPRTYLPGMVQSDLASPTSWTQQTIDNIRTAADSFLIGMNTPNYGGLSDLHLGTVSFVHKTCWRAQPVFRDFTPAAAEVDSRIDSARRRLGKDR